MNSKTAPARSATATIRPPLGELSTLGVGDLLGVPARFRWRSYVVIGIWVAALVLSMLTGYLAVQKDLSAIPFNILGFEAYISIYPPLIFCTLLLFWLGFWWAIIPAYLATLLLSLYSGMAVGWATLFAFSDTVGLAFLAIAYRSTGSRFDIRSVGSITFFVIASFIAALAGASGSFIWSHTRGLSTVETFAVWEGWWLGGFLQTLLFCGPLLFTLTPAVGRLKIRWFGHAVRHRRGAAMLTVAVLIAALLVCAFLLGNAHLSRLRLEALVKEGYTEQQVLEFANAALLNLSGVSVFLIVACGLGFLGLTARWNRELGREVRVRTRILEQSRRRIRAIIDLVPHMIFARDESGGFVFANRAAARAFGHSANELASSDKIALAAELPQLEELQSREQEIFAGQIGDSENVEILTTVSGENRRHRVSRLLLDQSEMQLPSVLTVAVDVTDQERVEARLQQLVDELADKNRELERFTYTVSHDLKSPIITIRGFAKEMQRLIEAGQVDALGEDLARIDKASARMQKLLDGLLVLSRSGKLSGPKQRVDMNRLVAEVVEIMQGQIEKSGATVTVADDLPDASGDPVRLFELVQNLLENATKFSVPGQAPVIHVGCEQHDSENRYFVEDNGVGIDLDDRERVFGLFEQVGPGGPGTGIGLSLARRILEVHGGRIWVEAAAETSGARFVFVLPAADATA